jgi:hypothetical protein
MLKSPYISISPSSKYFQVSSNSPISLSLSHIIVRPVINSMSYCTIPSVFPLSHVTFPLIFPGPINVFLTDPLTIHQSSLVQQSFSSNIPMSYWDVPPFFPCLLPRMWLPPSIFLHMPHWTIASVFHTLSGQSCQSSLVLTELYCSFRCPTRLFNQCFLFQKHFPSSIPLSHLRISN